MATSTTGATGPTTAIASDTPTTTSIPAQTTTHVPLSSRTPAMMTPHARNAPHKFKGEYYRVETFVDHYHKFTTSFSVSDGEKSHFFKKDWANLKADLLRFYDAARAEPRYDIRDLIMLANKWQARRLTELSSFIDYELKFQQVGGWLKKHKQISENDLASYFWMGIHKDMHVRIENYISGQNAGINLSVPFPLDKIKEAVNHVLHRDRFNKRLTDIVATKVTSELDEESSSDEDGSEHKHKRERMLKKLKKLTKKKHVVDTSDESDLEDEAPIPVRKSSKKEAKKDTRDDVKQIIKQLSQLSINDPAYSLLYYKALKLDSVVAQCIAPPNTRLPPASNNYYPRQPPPINLFPRQPHTMPPVNSFLRQPPPMGNMNSMQTGPPRAIPPHMNPMAEMRGPMMCYGCGIVGHSLQDCDALKKKIGEGVLLRDYRGRITFQDGTIVQRTNEETILQAAERQLGPGPRAHFFSMDNDYDYYQTEYDDVDLFAAEPVPKKTRQARKEVFDGVHIPPRRDKENQRPPSKVTTNLPVPQVAKKSAPQVGMGTRANPRPYVPGIDSVRVVQVPQEFISTPIDVRQMNNPRAPTSADIEMLDAQPLPQIKPTGEKVTRKAVSRQSEVSLQVGKTQILTQILNTQGASDNIFIKGILNK
ncbi:hypothetical protein FPV67DRAFT_1454479 [Lyophyllum atratum]|nr:hypothetical protein FPV67DRAFT_1454479 [Lyophyllum atratum]